MNKIIILMVLFITVIISYLIYKYNYYLNYINIYFSDPSNYKNYRLSDMVTANNNIRNNLMGKSYHLKYYPESIASKYLKQTDEINNLKVLNEIISEYNPDIQPPEDILVIHLRVGEILNHSKYTVNEFLSKERNFEHNTPKNFVKPLSYYKKIIENNKLPKKVKFFAGGCFCENEDKSMEYISKVKEFFEEKEFEVLPNTYFKNPDDDFVYMYRSKNFIKSGGGFSDLIHKMILFGKKESNIFI
jgi:hypothetical protein